MPDGTVKFFNPGKGFGFITPDGGAKDVFVPAASIAAAGVAVLKAGQRVSFEEAPDTKGPKAVSLKVLETPVAAPAAPRPAMRESQAAPRAAEPMQVTLYCDPSYEDSEDMLEELRAAGHEPRVVDYIAAPPSRDKLKELSSLLRGTDQSLVRQYDPLFRELRLDDRFISENEFWDGVVEHPSLINGPVVTFANRAAVCRTPAALKAFLAPQSANAGEAGANRKNLSPRLLRLIMGDLAPAPEEEVAAVEIKPAAAVAADVPKKPKPKEAMTPDSKPVAEPVQDVVKKSGPVAKPKAKAAVVAKPKAKAKPAVDVKKTTKKPVKAPAKKTRRG